VLKAEKCFPLSATKFTAHLCIRISALAYLLLQLALSQIRLVNNKLQPAARERSGGGWNAPRSLPPTVSTGRFNRCMDGGRVPGSPPVSSQAYASSMSLKDQISPKRLWLFGSTDEFTFTILPYLLSITYCRKYSATTVSAEIPDECCAGQALYSGDFLLGICTSDT